MRTCIRGGTVVTASETFVADVHIDGEQVVALAAPTTDLPAADAVVDATGCYVLPGGVDPHVHLDMPSLTTTTIDNTETGTAAAARGGTTTVINFAVQKGGEPLLAALDRSLALADGNAVVD